VTLRILVVNTGILSVPPEKGGAIELHTYYLANELAKLGNEVHYVTNVNHNASFAPRVILHRLPSLPFSFQGGYPEMMISYAVGGVLAFLKASGAIKAHSLDVVHGHGNISSRLLLPLARRFKFVFTVHNPTPWMLVSSSSLKRSVRMMTFATFDLGIVKDADCVIAVSEYLKRELASRMGIEAEKVEVIPNGVDIERFKPFVSNSQSVRKKYGINEEYALFVGRLVEQKGVHFLIKALAGTKLHAVIVGDGPLHSQLRDLSRRLGVDKQVHFVGAVPSSELPKFYAEAKVFVIPSLAEGLPLVGLEAMASGLPLIGSRIAGVNEIINDGCNGFLISLGDIMSLRQSLGHIFEDASFQKALGAHSRRIVEEQYSWRQVAKRTLQLYQKLV
jgi:glycosyltransferase involved in cell wall biosynthesis